MKSLRISSKDNAQIKHLKKLLAERSYRYGQRRYVLEGVRALDGLEQVIALFVREGTAVPAVNAAVRYDVAPHVFDAVAGTEQSQGVMAVCAIPESNGAIEPNNRYLFLDRIQDPGNMGTLIRTACAFGFDGVLLSDGCTDPYAPKAVRAAMGALHKMAVHFVPSAAVLAKHTLVVADAAGVPLPSFAWPNYFVLCIGSEAHGVSQEIRSLAHSIVSIPIRSEMESLNAAVAAGILAYAASCVRGI